MTGRRTFEVVARFNSALRARFELRVHLLPVAVQFLRRQGLTYAGARGRHVQGPEIGTALGEKFGAMYTVENWTEMNKSLYSALVLEKIAISLTIGLVVLVAALNIVASLVLLVMEKSRDIAILRTMGAPAQAIRLIFMLQGLVIGGVGTGVGAVLGLGVSYICDRFQLITLPGEVYQITHVPFRVEPFDVAVVIVSAIVVCWLATIYPARRAGQLDPAEALRYQ
jgi:lipoprotein-releasing system permease protein